jgi:hypothetical protein
MNNADMPANVVPEEHWDRSSSAAPATGLTKREHFAGLAMQGLLAAGFSGKYTTKYAPEHADALLAELAKTGE